MNKKVNHSKSEQKSSWKGSLIVLMIILLCTTGLILYERDRNRSMITLNETAGETLKRPTEIMVQIEGAVKLPGVYTLSANTRVYELFLRSEVLAEANLKTFNLARKLADGEKLIVPRGSKPSALNDIGSGQGAMVIDLNQASVSDLVQLPGVGPSTAIRIISYRDENGAFKTLSELQLVKGIGPKKFAAIAPFLNVGE